MDIGREEQKWERKVKKGKVVYVRVEDHGYGGEDVGRDELETWGGIERKDWNGRRRRRRIEVSMREGWCR